MLGPGISTTDPVIELLKDVQNKTGLSWGFLYWMFDVFSGLEQFMEDYEVPWQALESLSSTAKDCENKTLRKNYLTTKISNLDAFKYRAVNNDEEYWSPLSGAFIEYALRSDRFNVWKVDSDSNSEPIKQELRRRIHVS